MTYSHVIMGRGLGTQPGISTLTRAALYSQVCAAAMEEETSAEEKVDDDEEEVNLQLLLPPPHSV